MKYIFVIFLFILVVNAVHIWPSTRLKLDSTKNLLLCKENCYIQIGNPILIWCKTFGSQEDCKQILLHDLQKRENRLPNRASTLLFEYERIPVQPSKMPAIGIPLFQRKNEPIEDDDDEDATSCFCETKCEWDGTFM